MLQERVQNYLVSESLSTFSQAPVITWPLFVLCNYSCSLMHKQHISNHNLFGRWLHTSVLPSARVTSSLRVCSPNNVYLLLIYDLLHHMSSCKILLCLTVNRCCKAPRISCVCRKWWREAIAWMVFGERYNSKFSYSVKSHFNALFVTVGVVSFILHWPFELSCPLRSMLDETSNFPTCV